MFCKNCGTVLDARGECINCERKLVEKFDNKKQELALNSNNMN